MKTAGAGSAEKPLITGRDETLELRILLELAPPPRRVLAPASAVFGVAREVGLEDVDRLALVAERESRVSVVRHELVVRICFLGRFEHTVQNATSAVRLSETSEHDSGDDVGLTSHVFTLRW